ncbi:MULTISPECIES: HAAS signaling domain-containing protein [unclassified Streptomyces]|uniref:HAAS signaling domain-containing protein n=1 Tax=unclassified Streptomyces TaxID=2593676 RepID=UPI0004C3AC9D
MNAIDHPLVAAYLDAVARETAELPADRRAELLADLREHIEVSDARDDAGIRAVLAELGEPRTVAASALAEEGPRPAAPAAPAAPAPAGPLAGRQAARLIAALPALGGLVVLAQPALGALVLAIGLALLWMSPLWTARHKRIGTATAVAVPALLLLGGLMLAGGRIGPLEVLLLGVFLVAVPAAGAAVLLRALRD